MNVRSFYVWVDGVKNTIPMSQEVANIVWRKVGGPAPDSDAYSETHGEHEAYEEKNESPDGLDKLRRKGLI